MLSRIASDSPPKADSVFFHIFSNLISRNSLSSCSYSFQCSIPGSFSSRRCLLSIVDDIHEPDYSKLFFTAQEENIDPCKFALWVTYGHLSAFVIEFF